MSQLLPFFCYYGGKWRCANSYPKPVFDSIIEPFAGAAGYSTRHHQKQVTLIELNQKIAALWAYLIKVRDSEILSIPSVLESVDELAVEEQRSLVGFWMNKGAATPCRTPSSWMRSGIRPNSYWGDVVRQRIAIQVMQIKHWNIIHGSYESAEQKEATWFIDPPYIGSDGKHYRHSDIDYKNLAQFCRSRNGKVIVCEQEGAEWLPFKPHKNIKSNPSKNGSGSCKEVVWVQPSILSKVEDGFLF